MNKAPNPSKRVVIFGGTGYLGLNLAQHLSAISYQPILISRHAPGSTTPYEHIVWDGQTLGPWVSTMEGAAAIVNLAGRTVDCIKTPDHCDEILRSRVASTLIIGKALESLSTPPSVWVQMSTAHIYGDPPEVLCDEDAVFGYGLAPTVGKAWEASFNASISTSIRPVILRTNFVLGRKGGALPRLEKLTKFGLGGTVGGGRQGMSWIHETDMNRLFEKAITDPRMRGAYIATAPHPVSNKIFMSQMRKAMGVSIGLPATTWMAHIGARFLLNTDPELALYGRYCKSSRLEKENFKFQFPQIPEALADIFRN